MVDAMVGWLVCPIIKLAVDKAKFFVDDRSGWLLSDGIPKALADLEGKLVQLSAVAATVERRSSKDNRDLRRWLQQLKDAIYAADDILDDFLYQRLQQEAKSGGTSLVKFAKRFFGTDESLNKLKQVVKKLDELSSSSSSNLLMQATGLDAAGDSGHHHFDGRVSGSLLEDDEVIGRDEDVRQMVYWLTAASANDPTNGGGVPVAAIKGHGGMGKTMLAQLLFQHEAVTKSFDLMAWVQPVGTYDEVELAKQILQSLGVKVPSATTNFAWLQEKIKEAVSSQKFLLVLDDVWNREKMPDFTYREIWKKVLAPLKSGNAGSKIVVTTRKKIVADLLDASKLISLDGLQFDHIWSLFKKFAFCKDNSDKYPELVVIGKEIAKKLKGLPLAAKVVAQTLKDSRSVSYWKKVLNMEVYDDVNKTLELCYQNLPEHLQPCFAICSIFPKNWRFKRDRLVKIWMALDFICAEGANRLEDVGRDYFDQLVARSFFHVHKEGRRSHYYIHDLMHDLAENVSRYDCARVEGDKTKQIPETVRHLSVTSDAVVQLKGQHDLKRLRTLIILEHSSSSLGQLPDNLLKELKGLRVLDLDGCDMTDVSDKIGLLIHLRYLALCKTITGLPQSVTKLFHLQTLRIPKKCRLEKFPKDMRNLKYLRHLDMERTSTSKVPGIAQLVNLQGSVEFHVKKEKGHTLEDLNDMINLRRKLHIKNLDVVKSKQQACKAGLSKKQNIKVLELEWNSTGRSDPSVDAEVLEGLEPHPHVEEVHIRRYHGNSSPRWLDMSFRKDNSLCLLKSLHFTNCRKWEVLPPLGQLPCLKVLHLKEMCSLKQIGSEFYGTNLTAFPCLEDLEFDDMPKWVEWTKGGEKSTIVFPKLHKLKLLNCPHLIKVPSFPLSVRKATVENTGFVSHLKLSSSLSSKACNFALETCSAAILTNGLLHQQQVQAIVVLTLRHCQGVKFKELHALTSLKRLQISHLDINDEQLGTCLQGLRSLTSLEIVNCSNITTLPQIESPSCLTKFHELHIRQCPQLSSLHSLPSFATLETMLIENCSKITVESFPANFNGLNSLKKLSIMYCTELESLPSSFPSSLQVLHLIGCKPTLLNQLQIKDGPEWDKVACIPIKLIH